ncbi:MAG: hypothetical protein J5556_07120 [Deltaproteobacteria bacterium]|nr:hypothetical protein [Deltaproteobacteria bacterium]
METKEKTALEQLAELLRALPDAQREAAAAHLLGVMQGMQLQAALNDRKAG